MIQRAIVLLTGGWFLSLGVIYLDALKPATSKRNKDKISRIITLSPAVTELVFALGCGDRVIAVSDFCMYPPEVISKGRAGGYFNPNLEKIIASDTDCVILQGQYPKLVNFCRRNRIRVVQAELNNIDSIFQTISVLGKVLNCKKESLALRTAIRNEIRTITETFSSRDRVQTFFCFNRKPGKIQDLYTINSQGFLGELLADVGGENCYGELPGKYPKISKESLLKIAPEVIIEAQNKTIITEEQRQKLALDWKQLSTIPAVKNNRIHVISGDYLLVPGPRIPSIAEKLAESIHGEAINTR